ASCLASLRRIACAGEISSKLLLARRVRGRLPHAPRRPVGKKIALAFSKPASHPSLSFISSSRYLRDLAIAQGITSHTNIAGRREILTSLPSWQRNSRI